MLKIVIDKKNVLIDGEVVKKIARRGEVAIYSDSRQNDCFYIVNCDKVLFRITADCSQNWAFMNVERV